MRLPIIRPKIPPKSSGPPVRLITSATPQPIAPSTSNPRPLISLLDRTEFRDRNRPALVPTRMMAKPKKCYYTEMADIRKEFGIPEALDTVKPNTMSGVALASKLNLLQRLRGENKFLRESIETRQSTCDERLDQIEGSRNATAEAAQFCQALRDDLNTVEMDIAGLRAQEDT
ncbi:Cnn_1N domain-containing protein [Caenorhabditis elegans]|nr:Cnn_1N domain-containing protein [Caenorhabditis elegans]CDR32654.1 Cnn_1N domain-containing protein [Caenorhabditis elegans]|eukprot:NP_001293286.1 Uncharacterized protein CELE_Y23H5A.2 [Caenorhabditis elegans]